MMFHLLIFDTILLLIFEIIPVAITDTKKQLLAISLSLGIGLNSAMTSAYVIIAMLLDLYGAPLPLYLRHSFPFLSTSVREFWGIRWNPFFRKVLQLCYYEPLRIMGAPRLLCLSACFLGSSLLHGLPVFHSTFNWSLSLNIAIFFSLQIAVMVVEETIHRLIGCKSRRSCHTHVEHHDDALLHHVALELIAAMSVVLSYYCIAILEEPNYCAAVLCGIPGSLAIYIHANDACTREVDGKTCQAISDPEVQRGFTAILGWIFTMGSLCVSLPLFSVPMLECVNTYYASVVVSPLLRSMKLI
jgi:hypothetical protein